MTEKITEKMTERFTLQRFKHDCIMWGTFFLPIVVIFSIGYYFTRDLIVSGCITGGTILIGIIGIAAYYVLKVAPNPIDKKYNFDDEDKDEDEE